MSMARDEQTAKAGTEVWHELGLTTQTLLQRHVVSHVQTEEDKSSDCLPEALALPTTPRPGPTLAPAPTRTSDRLASCAHSAPFLSNSVDLDPVRRLRSRRPISDFSRVLKLRSPISEVEADTTCFDEFFVSGDTAFRIQAIVSEGSGAQGHLHATTTRTLLSSDPNCAGRVLEEVIEVAAHPRALYNANLGRQIHLAMSARHYTAPNVCF